MSKVTRSKLKFLIYILLQETNKINRKFFQILNDFFRIHSSASRAFVTRKRFSACWGNSPIPIERCLRHRAVHPFRMLQRQFLPKKKARCSIRSSWISPLRFSFHLHFIVPACQTPRCQQEDLQKICNDTDCFICAMCNRNSARLRRHRIPESLFKISFCISQSSSSRFCKSRISSA